MGASVDLLLGSDVLKGLHVALFMKINKPTLKATMDECVADYTQELDRREDLYKAQPISSVHYD